MEPALLLILTGSAVAGFVQGLTGFAFSMVALSFWAWVIGPQLSAPMAVFGALVGQLVALPFVWRGFSLKRLLPLVIGGLVGVPFGALVLRGLDPAVFRLALGVLLVCYSPFVLFAVQRIRLGNHSPIGDTVAGWIGGVLGGISGVAGAIPTLWTTMRGWGKDEQRGVLQAFNIAMHVATLTAYLGTGTLTRDVVWMWLVISPAIIAPAIAGVLLFHRLDVLLFRRLVLLLLFVSGVVLLVGSVPAVFG
jgi:uncharacterized membrane protein YfcA